jgi:hypothetical protein
MLSSFLANRFFFSFNRIVIWALHKQLTVSQVSHEAMFVVGGVYLLFGSSSFAHELHHPHRQLVSLKARIPGRTRAFHLLPPIHQA